MASRPTIVRNPADDLDFARAIEDAMAGGVAEPHEAQRRLRQVYPRAVVRRRELAGEHLDVWYIYREGRWIRGGESSNGR
jgi:hypothetical protein